ncbi:MAG TPA: FHA domain-containing protein [Bryobacteraceae bacterium]|jgi:DNA-directed RNA polymerase subunit RPC12/RpoP|nr:FHA domain-containing protein [Bryobacteraceae bacterium]
MPTYACPKGHQSSESDFCSECGAKITAEPIALAADGARADSSQTCPDCGAARPRDSGIFCEVCGYNFETQAHGELPLTTTPAPEPEPSTTAAPIRPLAQWTLLVTIDPSLRETGSPDAPVGVGPFTIHLDKPASLIGRKSASRGIFPEVPLDFDDAVSHRHALIEINGDGALMIRDIGAANGTRLNGKDVEPMVDFPLQDGDAITLGHWTRITVKAGN